MQLNQMSGFASMSSLWIIAGFNPWTENKCVRGSRLQFQLIRTQEWQNNPNSQQMQSLTHRTFMGMLKQNCKDCQGVCKRERERERTRDEEREVAAVDVHSYPNPYFLLLLLLLLLQVVIVLALP